MPAIETVVVVVVACRGCCRGCCVGRWWSLSVVVIVDRSWLSGSSSSWCVVVAVVEFLDKTSLGCRGSLVVVVGLLWSLVIVALLLLVARHM